MKNHEEIIGQLPYAEPFLFVEKLIRVDEQGSEGSYTFDKDLPFYRGHFKEDPVTPGVILTECCAQIGLVSLGIFLLQESAPSKKQLKIAMSSSEMEFYLPVYPGEQVVVTSEKIYFRFNKLRCKVKMYNSERQLVCKGELAGMLKAIGDG